MGDNFQHLSFIRLQCFDKFSLHSRSLNNVTLVSSSSFLVIFV